MTLRGPIFITSDFLPFDNRVNLFTHGSSWEDTILRWLKIDTIQVEWKRSSVPRRCTRRITVLFYSLANVLVWFDRRVIDASSTRRRIRRTLPPEREKCRVGLTRASKIEIVANPGILDNRSSSFQTSLSSDTLQFSSFSLLPYIKSKTGRKNRNCK